MKNIRLYTFVALVFAACVTDAPTATRPAVINQGVYLGVVPAATLVTSTTGPVISDFITINMTLTPGAWYSLQLTLIDGTVINTIGFTAEQASVQKIISYGAFPNGAYDLNLLNTLGQITRVPIIINH